jgi:hypothetical protein
MDKQSTSAFFERRFINLDAEGNLAKQVQKKNTMNLHYHLDRQSDTMPNTLYSFYER